MRGCAPVCWLMSMSSRARPTAAVAALTTGSALPAKVTTLRLCVSSREWSSSVTPSIWPMARTISSRTSGRRPSEKLGTHSMRLGTPASYCAVPPHSAGFRLRFPPSPAGVFKRLEDFVAMYARTMSGTLFLVAVPIGNLGDITLRALETLRGVDLVAVEDTRHFATLARAHGFRARTVSLHEHNEEGRVPELLARLRAGEDVAIVSDAGTPLVSDPGYRLVTEALAEGLAVTSLPGPSAITTALAAAGLPPVPFRFCGFAPRAAGPRRAFYEAIARETATLVVFEAPHRLLDSLHDAWAALGNRT